jgi:hypothetical protein
MMTDLAYDVPLLRKVREQILHHPETHDQGWWMTTVAMQVSGAAAAAPQYPRGERYFGHRQKVVYGTTACVAGWTVQLAGWQPVQEDAQAWADGIYTHRTFQVSEVAGAQPQTIPSVARRLLGLDETQADTLFDANNTRGHVLDLLEDYITRGEDHERADTRTPVRGGAHDA